ncbi:ABC transporter permease [Klebsiella pneumoniae]|uniref:ABC transporter permease n=1 Tax=Klebsiella pneumoniae TaxID=573 RepID=UPI004036A33A
MLFYFIRRLLQTVPVLIVISILVFAFIKLLPGDPARLYAGPEATPQAIQSAREVLGLDKPVYQQYINWVGGVLRGDLGLTFRTRQPVLEAIKSAFPATLWLALASFGWSATAGMLIGVFTAMKRGKWQDWSLMSLTVVGVSMPSFWLGLLLIQFVALPSGGLFSVSGFTHPRDIVLPAVTLGSSVSAVIARFTRSAMLESAREDFVRTARAKGLKPRVIVWKHIMRNALIPIVTMLGLQFGFLLSGSIVVESVFSWPGLGWLLIESIQTQDQPVIQALILLFVIEFMLINLVVDLLYALVNPTVRLTSEGV